MKRTILATQVWWFNADGATFEESVKAACAFHLRRLGTVATHCSVDPSEPGIVGWVGEIRIVSNGWAGVGNFAAHLVES